MVGKILLKLRLLWIWMRSEYPETLPIRKKIILTLFLMQFFA